MVATESYESTGVRRVTTLLLLLLCLGFNLADSRQALAEADTESAASEAGASPDDALNSKVSLKDGIDIVCESNVFFSWRRTPQDNNGNVIETEQPPEEVFYTTVGERGVTVEATRNRLLSKLRSVETAALSECRERHQDRSQCVATNLRSHSQEYTIMDFKARAALLEAIKTDCASNAGACISSRSSEPRCYLNPPPDATEKKAPEEEKKKKAGP